VEYVVVSFYETRTVIVDDGYRIGETNSLLQIEPGTHEFSLAPPQNYSPSKLLAIVVNTSPSTPCSIEFVKS
jgi:hypothetical protein